MHDNMTRRRIHHCSNPDCPHERQLRFHDWIRDNCPKPETHYTVFDVDIVLRNHETCKLMFIEQKIFGGTVSEYEKCTIDDIKKFIVAGIYFFVGWEFLGYHIVVFEKTCFDDGKCWLDGKEITEAEMEKFLTF